MKQPLGIAGHLARTFLNSKLTPLIVVGSLVLGAFAVMAIPREEDPQIQVPMLDVMTAMPGESSFASSVTQRDGAAGVRGAAASRLISASGSTGIF